MTRSVYRKLPQNDSNPREIAEVVNNLVEGKSNNTGTLTLAQNTTTTTLYDERIGANSIILFTPITSDAVTNSIPYGSFSSDQDQYATAANTQTVVTLNTTDMADGTYLSSNKMYVRNAGVYNVQFSLQYANNNVSKQEVSVWLKKNGTNLAGTGSKYGSDESHGGIDGYLIAVANFYVQLAAGDYIELYWQATAVKIISPATTGVMLEKYTAAGNVPAIPSAVVTLSYASSASSNGMYVSSRSKGSAVITHFYNSSANKKYGYIIVA